MALEAFSLQRNFIIVGGWGESPTIGVYPLGSFLEVQLLASPLKGSQTLAQFKGSKFLIFHRGKEHTPLPFSLTQTHQTC